MRYCVGLRHIPQACAGDKDRRVLWHNQGGEHGGEAVHTQPLVDTASARHKNGCTTWGARKVTRDEFPLTYQRKEIGGLYAFIHQYMNRDHLSNYPVARLIPICPLLRVL